MPAAVSQQRCARGTTIRRRPKTGDAADACDAAGAFARGELRACVAAGCPVLQTSLAIYRLDLASELLFVGDAPVPPGDRPSR